MRLGGRSESSRLEISSLQQSPDAAAAVGDGLRRMFDEVVAAPMPSSLIELCDALEDAFRRGELAACASRRKGV